MYYWFKYAPPMGDEVISYVRVNGKNSFTWFSENEDNSDYQQYLAWLSENNTPEEWNPE